MLTTHALFQEIAAQFPTVKPHWESIIQRFRATNNSKPGTYSSSQLVGYLAELYVTDTLERLCVPHQPRITPCPPPSHAHAGVYQLTMHDYGLLVKKGNTHYCQVDGLLCFDDIPVVVEVKSSSRKSSDVIDALGEVRITRLTEVLHAYFASDHFSYAVFLPSDQIFPLSVREKKKPSGRLAQWNFLKRGGVLVSFYTHRSGFRADALAAEKMY